MSPASAAKPPLKAVAPALRGAAYQTRGRAPPRFCMLCQASSSSCQCPAAEAVKQLNGHRWREGDVALLAAAAARLGLPADEVAAGVRQEKKDPQQLS